MHEIVTIQLGQRANYVATHYWNTQESYHTFPPAPPSLVDHDISFRQGIGADGVETYMPRTVIYDLKGGFGSLKRVNELYELEAGGEGGVWNGPTTVRTAPIIQPSPYIASLSSNTTPQRPPISTVKYWSDFSHLYYHPRSIVQLNDYSLGSSLQPFENYSSGDELFDSLDKEHDLLDRDLRLWAEECDHMQGVQLFTGADDAWGGFAGRYVERIRDEYGKVGIWVWGIEDDGSGKTKEKQMLRTINAAQALHDISAHASFYIPLSNLPLRLPKYVSLKRSSEWHTSALLATAIDSVTLPCRLRGDNLQRTTFDNFEAALNVNGNQRIAQLGLSILNAHELEDKLAKQGQHGRHDSRVADLNSGYSRTGADHFEDESERPEKLDLDLLPSKESNALLLNGSARKTTHIFGRVDSFRGPFERPSPAEDEDDDEYARKRRRLMGASIRERYQSSLEYELLDTFPDIFSGVTATRSVAIHSSLSTTTEVANYVKTMQKFAGRMVGAAEREALTNGLGEIGEGYEEGFDSGSDGGSDE
ncbi:mtDNA inheritance, partitioning of the mitochondrial organelle [Ptychographa xylographoides]|nr:mtDNA inheritance, partitioning of the mitochondrial organelle [Ptychographa xylographoides]